MAVIEAEAYDRTVESEPDELKLLEQEAVARLQERQINIDTNGWRNLIPSIKYGDLNSRTPAESNLAYQPDEIIAVVDRNGHVTIDRTADQRLNKPQKLHVRFHEAGHRLDWLLTSIDNVSWREISDIVAEMDPNDLSSYVTHLAEKYRDAPPAELAKIIRQEAVPELICQYIESDGSFKSFVEQSGLMTDDLLTEFEELNDEAKEEFFTNNPDLQFRFHVFVNLREILSDDELIGSITSGWGDDYDSDFYDDEWLVAEPAPIPDLPSANLKKNLPPKPAPGFFDLFWLFRKNE